MAKIDELLSEYGESHQNSTNKLVHWICVPAIAISLLGLIWCIPVPQFMQTISTGILPVNWATLFVVVVLVYYINLSVKLALGMLLVMGLFLAVGYLVAALIPLPLWGSCLIIFTIAWIGQFWGHKIEGKKPSFLKDIQFLLIGPAWLLSFIYQRLGISYS